MKRIILGLILIFQVIVLNSCSSDSKGPLHRETISYSSYTDALNSWNYMNQYHDEGHCASFDFSIEEYQESSRSYFISGIDVTSRYENRDNKPNLPILSWKGMYVCFSKTFYILFTLKNCQNRLDFSSFEWKIYEENINGKQVIHDELGPEIKNYYYWGYYGKANDCDVSYCFCDSNKNLGLIVGFSSINTSNLFEKYKVDLENRLMEVLNV